MKFRFVASLKNFAGRKNKNLKSKSQKIKGNIRNESVQKLDCVPSPAEVNTMSTSTMVSDAKSMYNKFGEPLDTITVDYSDTTGNVSSASYTNDNAQTQQHFKFDKNDTEIDIPSNSTVPSEEYQEVARNTPASTEIQMKSSLLLDSSPTADNHERMPFKTTIISPKAQLILPPTEIKSVPTNYNKQQTVVEEKQVKQPVAKLPCVDTSLSPKNKLQGVTFSDFRTESAVSHDPSGHIFETVGVKTFNPKNKVFQIPIEGDLWSTHEQNPKQFLSPKSRFELEELDRQSELSSVMFAKIRNAELKKTRVKSTQKLTTPVSPKLVSANRHQNRETFRKIAQENQKKKEIEAKRVLEAKAEREMREIREIRKRAKVVASPIRRYAKINIVRPRRTLPNESVPIYNRQIKQRREREFKLELMREQYYKSICSVNTSHSLRRGNF